MKKSNFAVLGLAGLIFLTAVCAIAISDADEFASGEFTSDEFASIVKSAIKNKKIVEYVESKKDDKIAFTWRRAVIPSPQGWLVMDREDTDLVIVDKETYRYVYHTIMCQTSIYALYEKKGKLVYLEWEFEKYGDSLAKTRQSKIWKHSKAYIINWDGTGRKEVNKKKYYHSDFRKR